MLVGNTGQSWGAVQRCLHWTLAAMVLGQLVIGDVMLIASSHSVPGLRYFVHPTVGVLIGLLMILRLGWRESHPVPAVPKDIDTEKQVLSLATHYSFYFLLIVNPLVGYLLVCAQGDRVRFFTWTLPTVMSRSSAYETLYFLLHLAFGLSIGALVVLHAGAALFHEFVKRDNVLRRMLGFIPMTAERQAVQDDLPPHSGMIRLPR